MIDHGDRVFRTFLALSQARFRWPLSASDIYSFFGVASSTGQGKFKQIRQWLKSHPFSFQWGLPSKFDSNLLIWTLTVDGMMVDVRHLPIEVQEVAYQKGLIPYVPGSKHS